jgi:putative ABC transport system ATP-binding protein
MPEPLISIDGLSHWFGDGSVRKEVLHDVSVDFYPGEVVIIMGPSGAGKTTLLSLAGALRSVQSGSIRLGGVELRGAKPGTLVHTRRRIGFVFQAHNLVESLTICENVQIALAVDLDVGPKTSRQRALELLSRVGLAEFAHKMPRQLSGGQKQRVAIARALVRSPQIIMADEPTAALDRHSGREIVKLLQYLAREMQCAVLLVTHDNRILDVADRILTLEDGRIEESSLALDRLAGEVAGLVALLAEYPAAFHSVEAMGTLAVQFAGKLQQLVPRAADLVDRRQAEANAMRSEQWAATLADLAGLDESLRQAAGISAVHGEAADLADAVSQGLEFLLRTAAEAFATRSARDVETLLHLTSDRGHAREIVERSHEAAGPETSDETRDLRLDLIDIHFRCVYFVGHIAWRLKRDIEAAGAQRTS